MTGTDVYRVLELLVSLPDESVGRVYGEGDRAATLQTMLFSAIRAEQQAVIEAEAQPLSDAQRILALAQAASREVEALVAGRPPELLDTLRDGDWTLRDLLRHAIAVEQRYFAQVEYGARRAETDPVRIPEDWLPCNTRNPSEQLFGSSRVGDIREVLRCLAIARAATDGRLRHLSPDELARPSIWGRREVTVHERLHQIGAHLLEVGIQAEKMLQREGFGETRRIMRRLWALRGQHERFTSPERAQQLQARLQRLAELAVAKS